MRAVCRRSLCAAAAEASRGRNACANKRLLNFIEIEGQFRRTLKHTAMVRVRQQTFTEFHRD
jgi:hypothetical protein